jgi:hypothetical protein
MMDEDQADRVTLIKLEIRNVIAGAALFHQPATRRLRAAGERNLRRAGTLGLAAKDGGASPIMLSRRSIRRRSGAHGDK